MSFRTWMYILALGVVTALVWFSWEGFSAYKQSHANERDSASQHYAEATQEGVNSCSAVMDESGVFNWLTCLAETVSAEGSVKQAEYDLKAQQDMAAWALGMLIVTIWLTIITLGGVIFVAWTFRDAREIGRKEIRAYLGVESASYKIPEDGAWKPNDGIKAEVIFKNYGASPARKVQFHWRAKTIGVDLQANIADEMRIASVPDGGSFTLGSNAAFSKSIDNVISADEYASLISADAHTFFFGRLDYQDVFGGEHSTEFCMRVENFGTDRVRIWPFGGNERET
jgi:hypothetical protein